MKDSNIYLKNILDKAEEAIFYCDGMSEVDLMSKIKSYLM